MHLMPGSVDVKKICRKMYINWLIVKDIWLIIYIYTEFSPFSMTNKNCKQTHQFDSPLLHRDAFMPITRCVPAHHTMRSCPSHDAFLPITRWVTTHHTMRSCPSHDAFLPITRCVPAHHMMRSCPSHDAFLPITRWFPTHYNSPIRAYWENVGIYIAHSRYIYYIHK